MQASVVLALQSDCTHCFGGSIVEFALGRTHCPSSARVLFAAERRPFRK